jgi:pimeloyl-ACP methyl ester carboxylesterase
MDSPVLTDDTGPAANTRFETMSVNGIATAVRSRGEPESEAVVFVHGFVGSGADFEDVLEAVEGLAYAVALDMPNHGRSERVSGFPCTVRGYADHLGAFIRLLGIERVHLVLHDFGGPWGLQWAVDHQEAVASVTLFNIGIMPGYRWHLYARIWRTPLLGELFMAGMARALFRWSLNGSNPHPFPDAVVDRMFDQIDSGTKRAGLALYRATDWGALSEQLGAQLAPRKYPALVVWGEGDRNLPSRYSSLQADYFLVEDVHLLPECGHWPFIDEPAPCRAALRAFLKRHVTRLCET